MNWSIATLLQDMFDAWSGENLPYTLGFWGVVATLSVFAHLFNKRRR